MTANPIFRFAPSPNGALHLGHAYSALYTEHAARGAQGRFLLRIEDIDWRRSRDHFIKWIFEDLAWLGLHWIEPVRRQSSNMAAYITALDRLDRLKLLYPCFCSRARLSGNPGSRDPDGAPVYPGTCRLLTADERVRAAATGKPYALRLDMSKALAATGNAIAFRELGAGPNGETGRVNANPQAWGDVVLARKDIAVSYHIAVVADDADQRISHITRGQDLFYATAIHRLLQCLLELPEPTYQHHRLIVDLSGRKLSKSASDRSLRSLRAAGVKASDIRAQLGF